MFTGIVKGKYPVVKLDKKPGLRSFEIELDDELTESLKIGTSISVDGVCLTLVSLKNNRAGFDAMTETLNKTTLSEIEEGDLLNIERSARLGDEIGGHMMSGHVSTMAEIVDVDDSENNRVSTFKVDPQWMRYIFSKGFIGLDGASLTVVDADTDAGTFKIWFIPETLRITRFGNKFIGDFVNVEIDSSTQTIVETVEAYLRTQK